MRRLTSQQRAHLAAAEGRPYPEYDEAYWDAWHGLKVALLARPATSGHCPLCDGDHDTCRYAAGSLSCVAEKCGNPHHREKQ